MKSKIKFAIDGQKFEKIPDQKCVRCGDEIFRSIFTGRWKHTHLPNFCGPAKPPGGKK